MKRLRMTPALQELYRFIVDFIRSNGYPPTVRDCVKGTRTTSTSVVNYRLNDLKELGYISVSPFKARGISLPQNEETFGIWLDRSSRHICDDEEIVLLSNRELRDDWTVGRYHKSKNHFYARWTMVHDDPPLEYNYFMRIPK